MGPMRRAYVPLGLTNATAEFQSFRENTSFDMQEEFGFPHLDYTLFFQIYLMIT